MTDAIDETHDPTLTSFVARANDEAADFPIQNLPFAVFRATGSTERPRIGVAIGDQVLDLTPALVTEPLRTAVRQAGIRVASLARACRQPTLNPLMALGCAAGGALRRALSSGLRSGRGERTRRAALGPHLLPKTAVELLVPATIGGYTDFYASIHHATNVGRMFRPDSPLLPNYKYVPIGYHGRTSSIVVSGTPVRRPAGQTKAPSAAAPVFGPSAAVDYECELGAYVGRGSTLGSVLSLPHAEEHLFGVCLVNDWSARDIQSWEYQPLGPFLSKNFATTVSPWVVTLAALAPFRAPRVARPSGDPAPLPYLDAPGDAAAGAIDVTLEVSLASRVMRDARLAPAVVSRARFADMYWTVAQLLTHHASNGCNLRPGDLIASGTVSGPDLDSRGCLLERTWRGAEPLVLPTGETRTFLEDGDEVIIRGWCERPPFRRIGFGECRGQVTPAIPWAGEPRR